MHACDILFVHDSDNAHNAYESHAAIMTIIAVRRKASAEIRTNNYRSTGLSCAKRKYHPLSNLRIDGAFHIRTALFGLVRTNITVVGIVYIVGVQTETNHNPRTIQNQCGGGVDKNLFTAAECVDVCVCVYILTMNVPRMSMSGRTDSQECRCRCR